MGEDLTPCSKVTHVYVLPRDGFFSGNSYGLGKIYPYIDLHPMKNFTIGYYYLMANVDLWFALTIGQRKPCIVILPVVLHFQQSKLTHGLK